jgi:MoxR-like ATPase
MTVPSTVPDALTRLKDSIGTVLLGKGDVIELALVALLGRGHLLIDDVPGVGKTLLARAMAQSIQCTFRRIQFTPDLLPSDILGSSVYDPTEKEFVFKRGPIFGHVILADEINRSSPRTQSALLEAMNDHSVSVDGTTHSLPEPFFVVATQNPFEFEGTYPLPESQLDRFMLRITVGYPPRDSERRVLVDHRSGEPVDDLRSTTNVEEILQLQNLVREIVVDDALGDYLLDIVHATRDHADLRVGASTRGALLLYRAAQARALIRGREFVVPDDIKDLVLPVLTHRIVAQDWLAGSDKSVGATLREIVDRIPVPG